ncbi:LAFE_0B08438g1_1 [Lachancea fermentati]|uniref:Sulfhydryl oxidase n=1 Tax=Lachancea fermentati TaxID=4955 RepID=A0A1G4M8B8_LACFM|nr:LAFE_0B08438g1_1 [Lachancea fermentati]
MCEGVDSKHTPKLGISGKEILYDEDGKPCRSCNSLLDFKFATGRMAPLPISQDPQVVPVAEKIPGSKTYEKVDPPDVEVLGRSSWTLLHTIAARYPKKPSETQKDEMQKFMTIFSHVYPCWWCAKDFEKFITQNSPKVNSRDELGRWLCDAHNEVNKKLGKERFDCNFWEKRWKEGWDS